MLKITVVDDDRDVRDMLETAMLEAGFDVKLAANGLRFTNGYSNPWWILRTRRSMAFNE